MAKINPIELQKALKGADYPASKRDLMETAEKNGASEEVRSALESLPAQTYEKPVDVSEALGDEM